MDMLVKLYELPDLGPVHAGLSARGITVRRALPYDRAPVTAWVEHTFGARAVGWGSECEISFARVPPACFIAHANDTVVGFACYDATCKGFLGPIGVAESVRRQGVGAGVLLAALHAMRGDGYAYAIIGNAGSQEFFTRTVQAVEIAGSEPGIYTPKLSP